MKFVILLLIIIGLPLIFSGIKNSKSTISDLMAALTLPNILFLLFPFALIFLCSCI